MSEQSDLGFVWRTDEVDQIVGDGWVACLCAIRIDVDDLEAVCHPVTPN